MTASLLARVIVTSIAAGQGVMPLFIDLNKTHATNPLWTGHARFHLVQQVCTLLPAAAVEVALLWYPGPSLHSRFYLAALLAATPLAGFLLAGLFLPFYGGALHDPNGIKPVRLRGGAHTLTFDMNVPIVILASALLIAAVVLFRLRG